MQSLYFNKINTDTDFGNHSIGQHICRFQSTGIYGKSSCGIAAQAKRGGKRDQKNAEQRTKADKGIGCHYKKLYESFAVGRISEERFDSLLEEYETEQKQLLSSVESAEQQLSVFEEDTVRMEQFLSLAKKYTDFSELTTPMINEFVDKVLVHAPEKVDGDRVQEIEIYLKFIGRFDLPEPEVTEEEMKRQEQLRRHRIKSRERYQKIKSGEHIIGEPFQLTCRCCGKTFESKMSNAMFCDQNCRAKYYRQEAAKKENGNAPVKTVELFLPQIERM